MLQGGTCFVTGMANVVVNYAPLFEVCWNMEVIGQSEEETDSQWLYLNKVWPASSRVDQVHYSAKPAAVADLLSSSLA